MLSRLKPIAFLSLVFSSLILTLSGCGSSTNNPAPTITSLSPSSANAGAAAQPLTITGTNFLSSSTVTYKGRDHSVSFISPSLLIVPLTAADQTTAGTYPVIVTNAAPGGGASSAVNFTVNALPNPVPTVTSLSPTSIPVGTSSQTLKITGTNFLSSSTVTFNGTPHVAKFFNTTSLNISLSASDLSKAGTYPVIVTNPTPGGGSSTAVNVTVIAPNPAPTLISISPNSIASGTASQTLTLTGTNFLSTSVVTVGGKAHAATFGSATSLTVALGASDLSKGGIYPVVVTNPAPGGGRSTSVNLTVTGGVTLSGMVYKGPSVGSTVTAYALNADGSSGAALGTATTDTTGKFSLTMAGSSSPIRLTSSGGNYTSEWDGTTITGTSNISLILDSATTNTSGLSITPASEMISSYTGGLLFSKGAADEPTAHSKAEALIVAYLGYLGLTTTVNIETLYPVFDAASVTSNPNGFKLGLYIGALATLGSTASTSSPDDLIAALSLDISDGVYDGKAFGTPVPLAGSATTPHLRIRGYAAPKATTPPPTLSPSAGTTDLLLALASYLNKGTAVLNAGITPDTPGLSTLEGAIFAGVAGCTCTPAGTGLQAASSGAVTTYSVDGRQYLIVAARREGVVVVDITDPTLTNPPINAWPNISTTTFGGSDVGGVISITGLTGHPQVLAYAYASKTIALLNLNTLITGNPATDNPVDLTTSLNLTNPLVGFSGGSAYIAGGIPDTGRLGIWLDTSDGYGLLTLSSLSSLPVSGSTVSLSTSDIYSTTQQIAENMGGDIINSQLLGGNYSGIQLIDLAKKKSYYMSSTDVRTVATGFSYDLIDGNSIDGNLHVGILTSEDTPYASFINLKTITETDGTGATPSNTFAPAAGGFVQVKLGNSGPTLSGSAVDKTSHMALFMAGYSDDFAVGKLQDPATATAGSPWTGLSDWSYFTIYNSPEFSGYAYATDPHSVGVIVNQTTGTPYGYLFDGSTDRGIIQIDMVNFLAMPRKDTTGDGAHQPAGDPGAATATVNGKTATVVTEFKWSDPTAGIAAKAKKTVTQDDYPDQPMIKH